MKRSSLEARYGARNYPAVKPSSLDMGYKEARKSLSIM